MPSSSRLLLVATLVSCANPGGGIIDDSLDGAGTAGPSVCGDGMIDGDEECDDENDDPRDECTNECTMPACGDGVVQGDEACDDGDDDDDNGCSSSCMLGARAAVSVSGGEYHTCAVSNAGTVRCWGAPEYGRLGQPGYDDYIGDDEPPSDWDPVDAGPDVVAIVAGNSHNCVLRSSGTVGCWGYNSYGQLGLGHTMAIGDDEAPSEGGDVALDGIVAIAAGDSHSCAIDGDGLVWCWGGNGEGELGLGHTMSIGDDELDMFAAVSLPAAAVEVVAGSGHTCARLEGGDVSCWGRQAEGQLGTGHPDNVGDDEAVGANGTVPLGGVAIDIDTRHNHTCAVLDGGSVRCWGDGSSGQLGYDDTINIGDRKTPSDFGDVMLEGEAVAITTGDGFTCALLSSGRVSCWGASEGIPLPEIYGDQLVPQAAADLGAPGQRLDAGDDHVCAILDGATVRCWGSNDGSRLGYPGIGSYDIVSSPSDAGDVDVF